MMTCKEVLDSLSAYLEEDLKTEIAVEMHKHIGMCSDCRAEFDTLTMTIKLYRHWEEPQMPPNPADAHTVAMARPPRRWPMKV